MYQELSVELTSVEQIKHCPQRPPGPGGFSEVVLGQSPHDRAAPQPRTPQDRACSLIGKQGSTAWEEKEGADSFAVMPVQKFRGVSTYSTSAMLRKEGGIFILFDLTWS